MSKRLNAQYIRGSLTRVHSAFNKAQEINDKAMMIKLRGQFEGLWEEYLREIQRYLLINGYTQLDKAQKNRKFYCYY